MEKVIRICALHDEAESILICKILNDNKIPYVLRKSEDAAYDGIFETQMEWAYIEAPSPYADSIFEIVKSVRKSKDTIAPVARRDISRKLKPPSWTLVLVLCSVFLAICGYFVFRNAALRSENLSLTFQRQVTWNWLPKDRILEGRWNDTKEIRYQYYDRNDDRQFEQMDIIGRDKNIITSTFDEDKNGLGEIQTITKINGDLIYKGYDQDENDFGETIIYYYPHGKSIKLQDSDNDLLYDKLILQLEGIPVRTIEIEQELLNSQP